MKWKSISIRAIDTVPQNFFANHKNLLDNALTALRTREYWSPWPEMPSPKAYGETANQEGKQAFEARLNRPFALEQPGTAEWVGNEESPFGFPLGITYPKPEINALMHAAEAAAQDWRKAGPESWTGVALESLVRLNRRSFELAYAVMHTTGQAFVMAFQAGGPHAQDRGLEAVAYAWSEMSGIPKAARWEKPQGKNPPLRMQKNYRIVPRGIGLVIGCCTFPTWNSYPGLFADLATGNAVIVKPHPGAVLPLAITVEVIRQVLADSGFDPNVITLAAHSKGDDFAQQLALRPEVKLIDFTGSSEHGNWLEQNARQAQDFAEKSGVNKIVIDSTDDLKGMIRNIAFSLSLYSAQMCTAPQNIYVSQGGIDTPEGRLRFDQVASAIGDGIQKLLGDPARAVEVLGAIQNEEILKRVDKARSLAEVVLDSKPLEHPEFKNARIRTPLLLKAEAGDKDKFMRELFGPISFIVKTDNTQQSIDLARRGAIDHGALTMSVYSTNAHVLRDAENAAAEAGVTLSCNLTGGVYVNQSAAFSDFHGSGMNPAANASITDTAFVANRFRVAETRSHA
jgi:phenylacetic acid degradation protein paaN